MWINQDNAMTVVIIVVVSIDSNSMTYSGDDTNACHVDW